jgi:hypothetical protein
MSFRKQQLVESVSEGAFLAPSDMISTHCENDRVAQQQLRIETRLVMLCTIIFLSGVKVDGTHCPGQFCGFCQRKQ